MLEDLNRTLITTAALVPTARVFILAAEGKRRFVGAAKPEMLVAADARARSARPVCDCLICELKVWAVGVAGHDFEAGLTSLSLAKDKRILVDGTLARARIQQVYAMGDCAAASEEGGKMLPPMEQAAHQQATYLAASFKHRLSGRSIRTFRLRPRGTLVSLGAGEAAGDFPGLRRGRRDFRPAAGMIKPKHRSSTCTRDVHK
jgi:NADH dehydrogenase FAD-containing subunit